MGKRKKHQDDDFNFSTDLRLMVNICSALEGEFGDWLLAVSFWQKQAIDA